LQEVSIFFTGIVEVSWSGENTGNTEYTLGKAVSAVVEDSAP
jgi:hypothetical protein